MRDEWRFVDTGPCSAAYNMALDEAIATRVRRKTALPTLRIYGWNYPSVTIGCFQRIKDIDSEYCSENHIPLVRRPTGGRALLHGCDLTYSFSVGIAGIFAGGLLDSYKKIGRAIGVALAKIGLDPELKLRREVRRPTSSSRDARNAFCFRAMSFGEIAIGGKKIVGSAQKRWPDGLLQQGSIPLRIDDETIGNIFRVGSPERMRESMTAIKEIIPGVDYASLRDALRVSFEEVFNIRFIASFPSAEEISFAHELEDRKYLSREWTFRR